MQIHQVQERVGERTLTIETGRYAWNAAGAVTVRLGDTVVFAASIGQKGREGLDFFPLQVDYREKTYAAGKIPGGFFKREGRPTTKETVSARLMDRPIRPLFPEGYREEVQVQTLVLSADKEFDPDILSVIAGSSSLAISDLPFDGPIGVVRVGRKEGKLILFPTYAEIETGDFEITIVTGPDGIIMLEAGAKEIPDADIASAIEFALPAAEQVRQMQIRLAAEAGKPKRAIAAFVLPEGLGAKLKASEGALQAALGETDRTKRRDAVKAVREKAAQGIAGPDAAKPAFPADAIRRGFEQMETRLIRARILSGRRLDGRGEKDLREILCDVGVLPRTHGSAVFSRGETQALVTATLGTSDDQQILDVLEKEQCKKRFLLHYNFPSFSTGEVKPIRGPGRREIGHGALAERSLEAIMPTEVTFPYTVRLVTEIMSSNGSSSMASTCGGTLALMDAGVPIRQPVAGISIGLVKEGERYVLLTDIAGEEDHQGDMDFKVAGTQNGITGIQVDMKVKGIPMNIVREAIERAREARISILKIMLKTIPRPRKELSPFAPRLVRIVINPEKIGGLIGPGGRTIRKLQEETSATIEVEDDGSVFISAPTTAALEKAKKMVERLTEEVKIGNVYHGKVVSIKDFGCFVELAPGTDGLCHISELADGYVGRVEEVVRMGDEIDVKVISVDDSGRIKLSRKAVLRAAAPPPPVAAEPPAAEPPLPPEPVI